MKRAAFALGLILLTTAFVNHTQTWLPMVEFSYVSQNCELMGQVRVRWFKSWPPKGLQEDIEGYETGKPIGPNTRCRVIVYAPTRTDERGRIAATVFELGQERTDTDTLKPRRTND